MDFDDFICMIEYQRLYVSRKRFFADKFESQLPSNRLFPFQLFGRKLSQKDEESLMKRASEIWNTYKESSNLLTSCWTLRESENYLMWKAYTRTNIGVRIESTIDNLVSSIKDYQYIIFCGPITYKGYGSYKMNELLFSKNIHYSGEEEFRFYFEEEGTASEITQNSVEIGINAKSMINQIILSPFLNKKAQKTIKEMIETKYTFISGKVKYSSINV